MLTCSVSTAEVSERTARHVRGLQMANLLFAALGAFAALGVVLVAAFPVRLTSCLDSFRSCKLGSCVVDLHVRHGAQRWRALGVLRRSLLLHDAERTLATRVPLEAAER